MNDVNSKKETLKKTINFRVAEQTYNNLIEYLDKAKETISEIMRKITYDFLRAKEENEKIKEDKL